MCYFQNDERNFLISARFSILHVLCAGAIAILKHTQQLQCKLQGFSGVSRFDENILGGSFIIERIRLASTFKINDDIRLTGSYKQARPRVFYHTFFPLQI